MFLVQFLMASSDKTKIRPIALIVWVLGRVKRWLKIRKKNIFFVLNKYQNVTHVSTCIFQVVFRSVALVTKKLWAILDLFFHKPDIFFPTL